MRTYLLVAALMICSAFVYAEDGVPGIGTKHESWFDGFGEKPTLTLSAMAKSGYLLGNGDWSTQEPVLQSNAFLAFKNGMYLDLWNSVGLQSKWDSGYDDELDFAVGWAGKLGKTGVSLDIGVYYFNVYPVNSLRGNDLFQLYTEWTPSEPWKIGSNNTLTPYIRTETTRSADGCSVNNDTLVYGGLKHSWAFATNWSINDKAYIVYDPGTCGLDAGFVASWQGQVDWQINKTVTWNLLWVRESIPLNVSDRRDTETVAGTGFTLNF